MEHRTIKTWALDDRPREKLIAKGKTLLSNAELIAILIGSGNRSESAVALSQRILQSVNDNLSSVNKSFIEAICRILEIDTKIIDSRELYLNGDKQEKLIQACKILNADIYLSGPAAKDYIEIEKFEKENISIEWMNYSNYKEYKQLSEPFEGRVTILDLIFNEGPNSRNFLKY